MHKKVLFCATVDYHFEAFHLPYMKWFKEQGWEVHVAAYGDMNLSFCDKKYNIPIQRSPFDIKNIIAYKELKNIIDQNKYQIIHCHTPVGGVLGRLASRGSRENGTKVIYTAHGFHFCKGAPIINWALYYPIEKWLANYTDCLITINEEDYFRAVQHRFKAKSIKHIHGVGVHTDRFEPVDRESKRILRETLGYRQNDFLMFYAAEFNKNKNQQFLINSLSLIKSEMPNAKLLLAGEGTLLKDCRELAHQLGIESMVDFLGYRNDIEQLLKVSDIAVASSLREGLPVNILEAMACGLPVIATKNRGHSELIENRVNGYTVAKGDNQSFGLKLVEVYQSIRRRNQMGWASREKVKKYSLVTVGLELANVYSPYMMEDSDETQDKYHLADL